MSTAGCSVALRVPEVALDWPATAASPHHSPSHCTPVPGTIPQKAGGVYPMGIKKIEACVLEGHTAEGRGVRLGITHPRESTL